MRVTVVDPIQFSPPMISIIVWVSSNQSQEVRPVAERDKIIAKIKRDMRFITIILKLSLYRCRKW
jgi:hypothetical protein